MENSLTDIGTNLKEAILKGNSTTLLTTGKSSYFWPTWIILIFAFFMLLDALLTEIVNCIKRMRKTNLQNTAESV